MHIGESLHQIALSASTPTSNNLEQGQNPKNGANTGFAAIRRQNLEHIKEIGRQAKDAYHYQRRGHSALC